MKLFYWTNNYGSNNFGDELNPWLWYKLLPNYFKDDNQEIVFIGIGTLINNENVRKNRNFRHKLIFSTGFGYEHKYFSLDDSYKIYCIRGPLTAKKLEVSETLAITDGALLVRDFFDYNQYQKKYKFAYMPHHELAGEGWNRVCQDLGFCYLDPSWPVDKILPLIAQSEIVLTEAMHGAIIADAFRIPWIPIVTSSRILSFKWHDWCFSCGIEYKPILIDRLHHPRKNLDFLSPLRIVRDWTRQKTAARQLLRVANATHPILSSEQKLNECSARLYEKLELFKHDWQSGLFS